MKSPARIPQSEWSRTPPAWLGHVNGERFGTGATVLMYTSEEIGKGPKLHVHEYDEIFVVLEGRALFTVGGTEIEAEAGDIVFGPAGQPHKFHNLGPGTLRTVDIHVAPKWVQENLPDPDART
jgi:mannose-6-phosphate isomerase-like protein (cupin superfamily)